MTSATEIGALQVRVGADLSGLTSGLAAAGSSFDAFGQSASAAFAGLDIASASVFGGLETTIVRAARGGEVSLHGMVNAMLRDLERLTTRQFITGPLNQLVSGLFQSLSFGGARAGGGPVAPNQAFLVGEQGPELFVPRDAGSIVPNGAGIGGMRPSIVFNVQTPNAQSFLHSETQIAAMIARVSARGQRNLQAMAFHEILFPTAVALGASGGPERKTEIVVLGSGYEERNAVWAHSRRRWNAGYGVRTLDDLHNVIAFFEARNGRLHGFRWRDRADWKSCAPLQSAAPADQAIGTGDGTARVFQLRKVYASGGETATRDIVKPVAGSVRCALDGVETSAFTVDTTTGLVTFTVAPAGGVAVTAGFHFDCPARFDTDRLEINLAHFNAGEIPNVPIMEIRV